MPRRLPHCLCSLRPLTCPYIVLLPTSSPHTSCAHKPHAGMCVPSHISPSCSFHSPCAFPKDMSAPDSFSCTKSLPAPANIPVSEQTRASTFLFPKGWMNCANSRPAFSQEGAPSVMKWDNLWDRHYYLFLFQRLAKLQCPMAGEGLTYRPLRDRECSLCKILCP